jgi:hypothetical protein
VEIRKHPMHIMPAMQQVKTYAQTGSFGADAVSLNSQQLSNDMEPLLKAARLHREAAAMSKLDGSTRDLEPEANKVFTEDGNQVESGNDALVMCTSSGDSTTYFVVQNQDNLQRVAYAVQSNLEMGGPPTQFFGVTVNLDTREYSAEKFTGPEFGGF